MPPTMQAVTADVTPIEKSSYIDWSGILVGALTTTALSWLLLTFGSAIGLLAISPYEFNSTSAVTVTMAAAIWFALTQIYSIGMGSYIAARLRPRMPDAMPDEVSFRDGVTGLAVWALAIITGLTIAAMATTSAARTGAQVAGEATAVVARQADPAYLVDLLLRPNAAQPGVTAPAQGGDAEAMRSEISRILTNSIAQGSIPDQDRQYLAQLLASRTGLSPQEAETRLRETFDSAKAAALKTADTVRKATSFAGFWIVFIMLASGLTAWWGATVGGGHRDDGTWF